MLTQELKDAITFLMAIGLPPVAIVLCVSTVYLIRKTEALDKQLHDCLVETLKQNKVLEELLRLIIPPRTTPPNC